MSSPTSQSPDLSALGRQLVPDLPERVLETYARLWQFETWLRRLVYVHVRALLGSDWMGIVKKAESPRSNDKRLTHMPTPEEDPLSYCQLSELCRIIRENWNLFASYLPPETIWEAKLEEIAQIRHRVAHFRSGHEDDLNRVLQFLRDLDQGFWKFCTSYNHARPVLPPTADPVVEHFLELDPFPYSEVEEHQWVRVGMADPRATFGLTAEVIHLSWANKQLAIAGNPGRLYDFRITGRQNRTFDYAQFLLAISKRHSDLVHICLDGTARSVRFTIPAVLGPDAIIKYVKWIVDISERSLVPGRTEVISSGDIDRIAAEWPEYVLGPSNALTFLEPEMRCSFFGV